MKVSIFSNRTLNKINNVFNPLVTNTNSMASEEELKEVKKIINKELQKANRRVQNLKGSKVVSPSYKKIANEFNTDKYTVFTIKGLKLSDNYDLEKIKQIYGRALTFLNEPTSTLTGAKEYIHHIQDNTNLPFDYANKILDKVTEPEILNSGLIDVKYNSIIDYTKTLYEDVLSKMEREDVFNEQIADEIIDNAIEQELTKVNIVNSFFSINSPRLK